MTTIKLDEDYRIESDTASWNLVFERTGGINEATGKPKTTKNMSFHATLHQALSKYSDEVLKPSGSVTEAIEKINETQELIKRVCPEKH